MADKDKQQDAMAAEPQDARSEEQPQGAADGGGQNGEPAKGVLQTIRDSVREDDARPSRSLTLRKILGGDILTAELVRSQIWLFVLIVAFMVLYVAFRYQCQQDLLTIDRLEKELKDAKYKALSSSSALTERCRESHILEMLRDNKDSLLHPAEQPPYIINVPEE